MAGVAVLLDDAEGGDEVFEGVAAAAEAGCVDEAVVGQCRGWQAVFVGGGKELPGHDVAGDGGVGGAAEQHAGVVIEEVEDLDVAAVG